MGRKASSKGIGSYLKEGFTVIRELDNANIYGVMLSEMISNIFKEGMWFKVLNPYMLIVSGDTLQVGYMLTINGVTRAIVGVASGRCWINSYGVEAVWMMTGIIGVIGILINVVCLAHTSLYALYFLNFFWAVYNGLWNSCLETSWSRSIVRNHRADVNSARQITNKFTTGMGPLFSVTIFMYYGNSWDIDLVTRVMLIGTTMTTLVVLLCFTFRVSEELVQDIKLQDIDQLVWSDMDGSLPLKSLRTRDLTFEDFRQDTNGIVQLTYPISQDKEDGQWGSRIKIMTSNFQATNMILVKQFQAAFNGVPPGERTCLLVFNSDYRPPLRVDLTSVEVLLSEPAKPGDPAPVNRWLSEVHCVQNPCRRKAPDRFRPLRILSKLFLGYVPEESESSKTASSLQEYLLLDMEPSTSSQAADAKERKRKEEKTPNISGANVIVLCDVLNAVGSGLSLKFLDLFLKVDYNVSPAGVYMVAFFQNLFAAWLTPYAKLLLAEMKNHGYRTKLGVVLLWSLALLFLFLLCIPGMPLWVVAPSIVLMQSLNSCTRAYNRAALVNYLPRDKIPAYMGVDAINKANQGGIALFGGWVVYWYGYRGSFVGTFIIFLIRILIYLSFTLRKGPHTKNYLRSRSAMLPVRNATAAGDDVDVEDMSEAENLKGPGDDEDSQLFRPSRCLAQDEDQDSSYKGRLVDLGTDAAFAHADESFQRVPAERSRSLEPGGAAAAAAAAAAPAFAAAAAVA